MFGVAVTAGQYHPGWDTEMGIYTPTWVLARMCQAAGETGNAIISVSGGPRRFLPAPADYQVSPSPRRLLPMESNIPYNVM